jgi:imidazolonepropionase-like amidohydrolase
VGTRSAAASPQSGTPVLALIHVNVVPMDVERVLRDSTVLVEDRRIAAVGAAPDVAVPVGARVIDGHGAYLLPGLADMHMHFINHDTTPPSLGPETDRALAAATVAAGVTSALGLCVSTAQLALRAEIARGEVLGPRLAISNGCIDDATMTAEGGVARVVQDQAAGFDFLKVYTDLSPEGFAGIVQAAHRLGMPIVGHIPARVGLTPMLDAHVAAIAHLEELLYAAPFRLEYQSSAADAVQLDPAAIPGVVAALRRSGTTVMPTLIAYREILDEAADLDAAIARPCSASVPDAARTFFQWDRAHNTRAKRLSAPVPFARLRLGWEFSQHLVKALADGGVPLLTGTDAPTLPGVGPGCAVHEELALLVGSGLTPYQALSAATSAPGDFFTREFGASPSGRVVVGARADLVLVRGDPLEDIRRAGDVAGVVLNGVWLGDLPRPGDAGQAR